MKAIDREESACTKVPSIKPLLMIRSVHLVAAPVSGSMHVDLP